MYQLSSFNTSLAYFWKPNEQVTHTLTPAEVSYTNLANSTAEFEDFLNENPTVRKSFEEQFIIGCSYQFVKSGALLYNKRHSFYISESIDLAGNLASVFSSIAEGSRPSSADQHMLLGLPYSQFVRLRNEMRYNYATSNKSLVAFRLITAVGFPYGNSTTMPYVR